MNRLNQKIEASSKIHHSNIIDEMMKQGKIENDQIKISLDEFKELTKGSVLILTENDMVMRKRKKKEVKEEKVLVYETEANGMMKYTDQKGNKYESEDLMKYKINDH